MVQEPFGRGGHANAILEKLGPEGHLFAIDKDPEAILYARNIFSRDPRFVIEHGSFSDLERFLIKHNVYGKVDGVLLDLGVSSPQLDNPERGFSFMRPGKLDMRMNSISGVDAATWIAGVSEEELTRVLKEYGEERFAKRIARAILLARQEEPITTTERLADIVTKAIPAWQPGKHPATRSFQAIRIAINQELDDLEKGLIQALGALKKEGRLVVISFHSLEDRIVKQFMQKEEQGDSFPAKLPIKQALIQSRLKRLSGAIKASDKEIQTNPRARSAILRVGEKRS